MNARHIAGLLATAKFILFISISDTYGFHADELYYIALSEHLQPAYADVPGFTPFIAFVSEFLFGKSLIAYRVLPAFSAAFTIYLTGSITVMLGGKKFATLLSCTALLLSPAFLATGYFLQPTVFEQAIWLGLAYALICHQSTGKTKYLILFAGLSALGLYNKYTAIIYIIGLLAGLLCLSWKFFIKNWLKWLYSFIVFASLISPLIWWQITNNIPAIAYWKYYKTIGHDFDYSDFYIQLFFSNGQSIIIWLIALASIITLKPSKDIRYAIVAAIFTISVVILMKGKPYYILGVFPPLFALGAVYWEEIIQKKTFMKLSIILFLIIPTLVAMPLILPVLPLSLTKRYIKLMLDHTSIRKPVTWDDGSIHTIPQFYADMNGWDELIRKVASASDKLTRQTGRQPMVLVLNYGIHGALITLGLDQFSRYTFSPNDYAAAFSPTELPDKNLIFLTKTNRKRMLQYSSEFVFLGEIRNPDAHIAGLKIYYIKNVCPAFKKRYQDLRLRFLGNTISR